MLGIIKIRSSITGLFGKFRLCGREKASRHDIVESGLWISLEEGRHPLPQFRLRWTCMHGHERLMAFVLNDCHVIFRRLTAAIEFGGWNQRALRKRHSNPRTIA